MDKANFYLILELTVDPPETDAKVIEETIKKKQAEWSRFRNHPTRGIIAQKYIGLIPEIQRVMLDPSLREKELHEAKKVLEQKEKEKFSEIDRHIGLLLSKGTITDQEVAKLAEVHNATKPEVINRVKRTQVSFQIEKQIESLLRTGEISAKVITKLSKEFSIPEENLRERVHNKKEQIFSDIDKYMNTCTQRGFITDKEINRLAALYSIPLSDVQKRIKCSVLKESSKKADKIKPLDKTIEKLINENLKIVGKSSLYHFLDLAPNAALEALQNRAKEKEADVRKIGQRDAVTSASGVLAGHCIAIFKSEEMRKAYDLGRHLAPMEELDSDIRLMGSGGKMLIQYVDILLRSSVRLGVDLAHADDYIKDFARKEKWTIELSQEKKRTRTLVAAGAIAVVLLALIIFGLIHFFKLNRIKKDYERVLFNVEEQQTLEEKEKSLQDFVAYHSQSNYSQKAQEKISEIHRQIDKQDFETLSQQIKALEADNNMDGVRSLYEQYLKKHADSTNAAQVRQNVSNLSDQIDNRDYEILKSTADQADYDKRIAMFNSYLEKNPRGKHVADVKKLISDTIELIYNDLKKELNECERQQEWKQCIHLCTRFVEKYKENDKTSEVKNIRASFQNKIARESDLADLKERSLQKGKDYEAAKQIYLDYLNANPESSSYIRIVIAKEVAELDQKIQKLIQEKKDWESLLAFCNNVENDIYKRVQRLEVYVNQNPNGTYINEAKPLLDKLSIEKKAKDDRLRAEHEIAEWDKTVAYTKDVQNSLTDRLRAADRFMKQFPNSKFMRQAAELASQLQKAKAEEDARIRAEQDRLARIQKEKQTIRSQLSRSGGRFVEKTDGIITDTKTGLMWSMVDSFADLGGCVDFQAATEYVTNLRTGGYSNWRIPTAHELIGIYKTSPFFPSSTSKWYWTSDIFWIGWNKKAYVVSTQQETSWNKENVDLTQCGAVRAVRQ